MRRLRAGRVGESEDGLMSNNFNVSPDYDFWEKFMKADETRKAVFTLINNRITPEQYEKIYNNQKHKVEVD